MGTWVAHRDGGQPRRIPGSGQGPRQPARQRRVRAARRGDAGGREPSARQGRGRHRAGRRHPAHVGGQRRLVHPRPGAPARCRTSSGSSGGSARFAISTRSGRSRPVPPISAPGIGAAMPQFGQSARFDKANVQTTQRAPRRASRAGPLRCPAARSAAANQRLDGSACRGAPGRRSASRAMPSVSGGRSGVFGAARCPVAKESPRRGGPD